MDIFGALFDKTVIFSLANTLYVVSYLLTSMLWLRALAVVAAASTLPYFYFQQEPLWSALFWQSMFLIVNLVNLLLLLHAMLPPKLDAIERRLHERLFSDLKPREMLPILRAAHKIAVREGEILLEQNQHNEKLYLLIDGSCKVINNGVHIVNIGPLEFIGEMSFIVGDVASADVVAENHCELYVWEKASLNKLFRKQSLYKSYIYQLCSVDMAGKLRNMTASAAA